MLEKTIEGNWRKALDAQGGELIKLVSPNRRGRADRIAIWPIPPEHREIVSRYFQFWEMKAPGKKPEPHQIREHERLRKMGFTVKVVDR